MFRDSIFLYLYIYFVNILAFALMAYDKHCAHYGKRRIPEVVLIGVSALLGAFGALCGMITFNHKTKKALFYIAVPILLFVQICGLAYYLTH